MVAMSKKMELTTLNILNLLIKWRIQEQRQYLSLADIYVTCVQEAEIDKLFVISCFVVS